MSQQGKDKGTNNVKGTNHTEKMSKEVLQLSEVPQSKKLLKDQQKDGVVQPVQGPAATQLSAQ